MDNVKKYNKAFILSYQTFNERINSDIYFRKEKTIFKLYKIKEGWYSGWNKKLSKVPDNCYVSEDIVFIKPNIIITYINNEKETIYFNSIRERNSYVKRELQGINWL